jgi:hypothetical protein
MEESPDFQNDLINENDKIFGRLEKRQAEGRNKRVTTQYKVSFPAHPAPQDLLVY